MYCAMYEQSINEVIGACDKIEVISDGVVKSFSRADARAKSILSAIASMNEGGWEMPGYGVSIDRLTREEMKKGMWLRLVYDERQTRNEMPFDSLLIRVKGEYCGYDLIRESDGKYQGRVFYFNLKEGKNMQELFSLMQELVRE